MTWVRAVWKLKLEIRPQVVQIRSELVPSGVEGPCHWERLTGIGDWQPGQRERPSSSFVGLRACWKGGSFKVMLLIKLFDNFFSIFSPFFDREYDSGVVFMVFELNTYVGTVIFL